MSIDLELIRNANRIENLIGTRFNLVKRGNTFSTLEHDSLVIFPATQSYYWYSKDEFGDIFDFAGRYLLEYNGNWNSRDPEKFLDTVHYLAEYAHISFDRSSNLKSSQSWGMLEFEKRLIQAFWDSPVAQEYVFNQRGLNSDTARHSRRIGYMPSDKSLLIEGLNIPSNWLEIIERFPKEMIVFVYRKMGVIHYLSGRSIHDEDSKRNGPKHYKPSVDLIGNQQIFMNQSATYNQNDFIVLTEAPFDALSFDSWKIPAISLGGLAVEQVYEHLSNYTRVILALDNDEAGLNAIYEIGARLGKQAYIFAFPNNVKDGNEFLKKYGPSAAQVNELLRESCTWLQFEAERIAELKGFERDDAIRNYFTYTYDMDPIDLDLFKGICIDVLGISKRAITDMLKQVGEKSVKDIETPELLDENTPYLSPALGFHQNVGFVTVALRERRGNYAYFAPYMITSNRELIRLDEENVIKIDNLEYHLTAIPDADESLMRWRKKDIDSFLFLTAKIWM
jgi:DNA primase